MKKLPSIVKKIKKLVPTLILLGLVTFWELGVEITGTPKWILPGPLLIAQELWNARSLIWEHTLPTLFEAIIGLICATITGVFSAFIMEWSPTLKKIFYPIFVATQTVPTIAIAPLLIIWFGFGMLPKIIIITLVCFFPITISMTSGFQAANSEWLKVFHSMGANRWQIFRNVKFFAALPHFFSGLTIAATYSILGAVVAEWFGAEKGLGILLMRSAKSYLTERVFATIIIIIITSFMLVKLIEIIARISLPWYDRKNISES